MAPKRTLKASDLYKFNLISDSEISPDGRNVIYAVRRVDKKTEKFLSNLWVVPTAGGTPRQFTFGEHNDIQPKWAPDGKSIAFLSNRKEAKQFQIYVIPFTGGEAYSISDLQGSFHSIAWSPNGKQLAVIFQKRDADALEREKNPEKAKLGIACREISRVFYKYDGTGYLAKERWHLWTVNVATKRAKQLTNSPIFDEACPSWSPDSKKIVFVSNRADDPDMEIDAIDLYLISAKGGSQKKITLPFGPKTAPAFSPDGKWIAYVGHRGGGDWWKNDHIWVTSLKGKSKCLTAEHDFTVSPYTIGDMTDLGAIAPLLWDKDSKEVYFQVSEKGNLNLKKVSLKKEVQDVIAEKGAVVSFSLDSSGKKLAYTFASLRNPADVWVRSLSAKASTQITKVNNTLLKNIQLPEVEEIVFKGSAFNPLHGWIVKPNHFSTKKKYPALLEIHGGPLCQYGNMFMFEFYFLAAQGYVVGFSNPRGGIGYGEKHAKAIWNNWGSKDYSDLMKFSDVLAKQPYVDSKRLGVTGGSYGGYMTNWIVSHTHKFKAAITQRCVSNFISMWGSSDVNWAFQQELGGKPPFKDMKNYWRQSPMKYIGNVKTPMMVIHSEQDLRCPQEQGEQVYVALKKLGVDTEFILFPEESHGLSRGGRTDRKIKRLNHILRWFDRYLK